MVSDSGHHTETKRREHLCLFVGETSDGYVLEAVVHASIISISTLCNSSKNSPDANTGLYHLRTKFEPKRIEQIVNTHLRRDIVDLHLRPYYGDKADTDGLYHSEAKRGTTSFHAYATLYTRVTNKQLS